MAALNIMIVDDDSGMREINRESILEAFEGSKVIEASDGVYGLKAQADIALDVIVSDFQMPRMDGGLMVELVRSVSKLNRSVPIIIVTGYLDLAKTSIDKLDHIFYLEKPYEPERLIRLIRLVTAKKNAN